MGSCRLAWRLMAVILCISRSDESDETEYSARCNAYKWRVKKVHVFTLMNVSKHMQLGLDSPLDGVEQLHAADSLHLLGNPVQET